MKNVGFIGWRGMVGSVLMQRMVEERDFDAIRPVFFSTSQLGQPAPSFGGSTGSTGGTLQDAFDLDALKALDIIVTCRAAITPTRFTRSCAQAAGRVTGLTRLLRCA